MRIQLWFKWFGLRNVQTFFVLPHKCKNNLRFFHECYHGNHAYVKMTSWYISDRNKQPLISLCMHGIQCWASGRISALLRTISMSPFHSTQQSARLMYALSLFITTTWLWQHGDKNILQKGHLSLRFQKLRCCVIMSKIKHANVYYTHVKCASNGTKVLKLWIKNKQANLLKIV